MSYTCICASQRNKSGANIDKTADALACCDIGRQSWQAIVHHL